MAAGVGGAAQPGQGPGQEYMGVRPGHGWLTLGECRGAGFLPLCALPERKPCTSCATRMRHLPACLAAAEGTTAPPLGLLPGGQGAPHPGGLAGTGLVAATAPSLFALLCRVPPTVLWRPRGEVSRVGRLKSHSGQPASYPLKALLQPCQWRRVWGESLGSRLHSGLRNCHLPHLATSSWVLLGSGMGGLQPLPLVPSPWQLGAPSGGGK